MANLTDVLNDIKALNASADALNARVHPPAQGWTVETPLSVNANAVLMGQNIHSWGDGGVIGRLVGFGCKSYHNVIFLGGNTTVFDQYVNEAVSLGVTPVCTLMDTTYGTGASVTNFVSAQVTRLRGKVSKFVIGNEPSGNNPSPATYLAHLKVAYAAAKAADPNCVVMGPATTADELNSFSWVNAFLALNPWQWLDAWAWHTYYCTPEDSYRRNLNVVPRMVATSAGRQVPMYIEEVGWWSPAAFDSPSEVGYTEATTSNYGSRYPFLAACAPNLRGCNFYGAHDEAPQQFGICLSDWTPKPVAAIMRDAFAHVHAGTGFGLYTRAQASILSATWFARIDTAGGQRLAIGRQTGSATERVFVIAPTATMMTQQVLGNAPTQIQLASGAQQVSVPAGQRAIVLSGTGLRFPEFS